MFYSITNGKLVEIDTDTINDGNSEHHIGVISYDEIYSTADSLGVKNNQNAFLNRSPRFESHEGFDFICIRIINYENINTNFNNAFIYVRENLLLFICDDPKQVDKIVKKIMNDDICELNFGRLLCAFFDRLTEKDAHILEDIEQEITELEDSLITTKKNDCVRQIVSLRKRLMILKRYYEQLLGVIDSLQENENNILDKRSLRVFKILIGRIDRLYHSILNLRDYVTQVREAYQSQVDISLNSTMKLITVVTSIFLPLTLVVGWYGMNLKMPEYSWNYGYPVVIGISIIIIIVSIIMFKKNKWF